MPSSCEVFVLRDGEGPILYAPLRRIAARVNEAAVAAVAKRLSGKMLTQTEQNALDIRGELKDLNWYETKRDEYLKERNA